MTSNGRLLVTGGSGLLGSAVVRRAAADWDVHFTYLKNPWRPPGATGHRLDISEREEVLRCLADVRPNLVVHCAGLRSLDYCEDHPEEAEAVNTLGTRHVAEAAARDGVPLAFISTDAVFDGEHGRYREEDAPNPRIAYGASKLRAEAAIRELQPKDHLIVRTSTIFGQSPYGKSLVEWIVDELQSGTRIEMMTDSYFSPVLSDNLAAAVLELAESGRRPDGRAPARGLLHVAGPERCSRYELAVAVADAFELDRALIEPVSIDDVRTQFSARRLKDSSLDVSAAQALLSRPLLGLREGLAVFRDAVELAYGPAAAG